MSKLACDFCGKKLTSKEAVRTHYGTGFGYIRIMCKECQVRLGAEEITKEEK